MLITMIYNMANKLDLVGLLVKSPKLHCMLASKCILIDLDSC